MQVSTPPAIPDHSYLFKSDEKQQEPIKLFKKLTYACLYGISGVQEK